MPYSSNLRIIRKIDDGHLVWFGESNRWVRLEEPAFYVYRLLESGNDFPDIKKKFLRKYSCIEVEALSFIEEITRCIQFLKSPVPGPTQPSNIGTAQLPIAGGVLHSYRIGKKKFQIHFSSSRAAYFIHPFLEAFSFKPDDAENDLLRFTIDKQESTCYLQINNRVPELSSFSGIFELKRKLFNEITQHLYDKNEEEWMLFLHASAVSNGKAAVLFPAGTGSGKTTLAALLCQRGFEFLSDDFVPVSARRSLAYPFPASLSLKEGAFPLFEGKNILFPPVHYSYGELKTASIRLIRFPFTGKPYPVNWLIFPEYQAGGEGFKLTELTSTEAIALFFREAWTSPLHAGKFINWFTKLHCYRLVYSDTHRTMDALAELLKA
jgi:hypothetical protein